MSERGIWWVWAMLATTLVLSALTAGLNVVATLTVLHGWSEPPRLLVHFVVGMIIGSVGSATSLKWVWRDHLRWH